MSGYELEIEQLRRAATAARSGGDQLDKVDASASMSAVPPAMPGSRCAGPLARLADTWRQQVTWWSSSLTSHGKNLAQSADLYAANEATAADVFASVHTGGAEVH